MSKLPRWAEDPDAVLRRRRQTIQNANDWGHAVGTVLGHAVVASVVIGCFLGVVYLVVLVVKAAWGGP